MLTAPLFKQSIQNLKNGIKGRALSSREMRQKANKLSGMDKHEIHLRMRSYGATSRNYLLAYALIRGIPYKAAEQSCRPGNEPSAHAIQYALVCGLGLGEGLIEAIWDTRQIQSWLDEKPVEMRAAA